ncbi:hypothetical protein C7212DRAFT_324038 [Tuber magnatum]|uniref:Uncharacterized protein n=1 Tax=Tuber magnatum TaxID=42249 RepID=A0A317SNF8_9PEZI|nr:hypothetical protein C7212DRAFT_324038 [Tuber magnatum]
MLKVLTKQAYKPTILQYNYSYRALSTTLGLRVTTGNSIYYNSSSYRTNIGNSILKPMTRFFTSKNYITQLQKYISNINPKLNCLESVKRESKSGLKGEVIKALNILIQAETKPEVNRVTKIISTMKKTWLKYIDWDSVLAYSSGILLGSAVLIVYCLIILTSILQSIDQVLDLQTN